MVFPFLVAAGAAAAAARGGVGSTFEAAEGCKGRFFSTTMVVVVVAEVYLVFFGERNEFLGF